MKANFNLKQQFTAQRQADVIFFKRNIEQQDTKSRDAHTFITALAIFNLQGLNIFEGSTS